MNCLHCNKPIEGKRNTKKYCSNTCKQYAYLNRSFASPTILSSVSLISNENKTEENNNETLIVASTNGNANATSNDFGINSHLLTKPISHYEDEQQLIEKEEYQYINVDILDRIQHGYYSLTMGKEYFTSNTNIGGRFTEHTLPAFSYMVPRVRCIIENLFLPSYKKKVFYKTIKTISNALEEILFSDYLKALPNDFPFFNDLLKLHEQFRPLAKALEGDKEGIKFTLNKAAIVRYILILNLVRDCTKKEPFHKLFPELYKTKGS